MLRSRLAPGIILFPYTTLFRSIGSGAPCAGARRRPISAWGVSRRGRGDRRGPTQPSPRRSALGDRPRSEEHTSELQSPYDLVCRLLLEKKTAYLAVVFVVLSHA